ncbi:MAG: galactose mutarotase [Candidatus Latescibacteria bacterium]|jgi:aldose 1-epimerase|nr:galactose mutarotase [Candidatus Latescibacterota bacterium]MBT5832574.1 galactose mutarotase [Candidatus Latescibacterota bacterium]
MCHEYSPTNKEKTMSLTSQHFGTTTDGQDITQFTLTNSNNCQVKIITYGAIVTSITVPDRNGQMADVVLGHDTLEGYQNTPAYLGAVVGRYGNRIRNGQFELNGQTYTLATNNGPNHLHGGLQGFDKMVWQAEVDEPTQSVRLTHTSQSGHEGYPGTLTAQVTYTLTDNNALQIKYHATTDQPTIVNLTNHSYFNLAGQGTIVDHTLKLNASHFTPVDDTLIPTGELRPVQKTPFNFTTPIRIGDRIDANDEQIRQGGGYDHNWVLDAWDQSLKEIAMLRAPHSGRTMTVSTTEPGVQFYTGNFLDGSVVGKGDQTYNKRTGLCLETQHFPNSPNQPNFPSTTLNPGEEYRSETVYTFTTK